MLVRSWLSSGQVVAGLVTAALSLGVAVALPASRIACRYSGEDSKTCGNARDLGEIVVGVATVLGVGGGLAAVGGRLAQGDLYTPHGLPGLDREELVQRALEEVADGFIDEVPKEEAGNWGRLPWRN